MLLQVDKFGGIVPKIKNPVRLSPDKSQIAQNCRFEKGGIVPLKEDLSVLTSVVAANLHVIKAVINDDGGTSIPSDFNLHVKLGVNDVSGSPATGVISPGTLYILTPGTYVLSEDVFPGYAVSFGGDCDVGGNIILASGDKKTGIITNDDMPLLSTTKSGTGTGTVVSDISGINCGSICSYWYNHGTTVVLTATPDSGNLFEGWSGDGTGTVTRSVLLDGAKVVNAEFFLIPKNDYLIGWYKFDEGAGTVVANDATGGSLGGGLLGNLAVEDTDGDFWTHLVGFGSTNALNGDAHAALNPSPKRTIGGSANGYACLGIFHKRTTNSTDGGRLLNMRNNDGNLQLQISVNNIHATDVTFVPTTGQLATIELGYDYNEWNFFFLDSLDYFCRVNPDGTLSTSVIDNGEISSAVTVGFIDVGWGGGGGGSDGCRGAYGDFIFYNFTRLTRAEWASWYDKLRSRYGMATRSGW